jgi:hypothetical protein
MSKQKSCGVVVACALLVAFALAQGGTEVAPTKTTAGAHKVTLDVTHLIASGFQLSAFVETGSTADVCLATYNASNQPEDLAPILCSPIEFRGKHGIRLFSYLSTHPGDDFVATITVFQQDAQYYTAPVRCNPR